MTSVSNGFFSLCWSSPHIFMSWRGVELRLENMVIGGEKVRHKREFLFWGLGEKHICPMLCQIYEVTHKKSILKLRSDSTVYLRLLSWVKPQETASHKEKSLCNHRKLQQSDTVPSSRAWLSLAQRGQQRAPHFNMRSHRNKSVRNKCSQDPYPLYPRPPKWMC